MMSDINDRKIEVAFFISNLSDISGIGKDRRKGTTPKDAMPEDCIPGHTVKNCMTADGFSDGALSKMQG